MRYATVKAAGKKTNIRITSMTTTRLELISYENIAHGHWMLSRSE